MARAAATVALLWAMAMARPSHGQEGWSWGDVAIPGREPATAELRSLGEKIYGEACCYCHGPSGRGDGSGAKYLAAKPANFTVGKFKVRSTPTGELPRDEDLFRTLTVGFPDYGMPRFAYLSVRERWALVSFVKAFSAAFDHGPAARPVELGGAPAKSPELMQQGEKLYADLGCGTCHGREGRGDGPSGAFLRDSAGRATSARDLTVGARAFKGGATARDITRTMVTGLTGSAMPAYEDLDPQMAWAISYYVESLAESGGR